MMVSLNVQAMVHKGIKTNMVGTVNKSILSGLPREQLPEIAPTIKMSRKLEDFLLDLINILRFMVSLKTSMFALLSHINKALQSFQEIQKEQRGGPG